MDTKTVSVEELAREARIVTHEEAAEAVLALTDEHFHNTTGRRTQFSIPARQDDTDVVK
jgi:hypothetical protein